MARNRYCVWDRMAFAHLPRTQSESLMRRASRLWRFQIKTVDGRRSWSRIVRRTWSQQSWFARLCGILLWLFVLGMPVYVFYVRQHLHFQIIWLDVLWGGYFLALPFLLFFIAGCWSDRRVDAALAVMGKLRTNAARTDDWAVVGIDEIGDNDTIVQVRRAGWRERLTGKPSLRSQFGFCRSDAGLRVLFVVANVPFYIVMGINVLLVDPSHEIGVEVAGLTALGAGCLYVSVGHFRYRSCTKRMLNAINHGCCPECGYPLRAHFQSEETRLHAFGPQICTECGTQWPLLPPPLDFVRLRRNQARESSKD